MFFTTWKSCRQDDSSGHPFAVTCPKLASKCPKPSEEYTVKLNWHFSTSSSTSSYLLYIINLIMDNFLYLIFKVSPGVFRMRCWKFPNVQPGHLKVNGDFRVSFGESRIGYTSPGWTGREGCSLVSWGATIVILFSPGRYLLRNPQPKCWFL